MLPISGLGNTDAAGTVQLLLERKADSLLRDEEGTRALECPCFRRLAGHAGDESLDFRRKQDKSRWRCEDPLCQLDLRYPVTTPLEVKTFLD